MPEAAWNFEWRWHYFMASGIAWNNQVVPIADTDDQEIRGRVHRYNAQVQQQQEEIEAERRRVEEKQGRFKDILLGLLSDENRRLLNRPLNPHILVTGSLGGKYRIDRSGHSGNVQCLSLGRASFRFGPGFTLCIHPRVYDDHNQILPVYGTMLAQLLMIVTDEERFLKTAFAVGRF
jgi:hypothetical protein